MLSLSAIPDGGNDQFGEGTFLDWAKNNKRSWKHDRFRVRPFVQMEYFGYMRRDQDDGGYAFWLNKLNSYPSFVEAEMVLAFILSPEYRSRFGQP